MSNFFYGMMTMTMITVLLELIDRSIPNGIVYYLDLYIPFV